MKAYIVLLFTAFFFMTNCYGQNEKVNLRLKWKVGDIKSVTITENIKKYQDAKLECDSSVVHCNKIMVSDENDSVYLIHYQIQNYLINPGTTFLKNLESELSTHDKYVELKYQINKATLKTELLNPIESDSAIHTTLNRIIQLLEKQVPAIAQTAKSQLNKCYSDNKDLEIQTLLLFPDLLHPYNKSLVVGDTLITVDSLYNPIKIPKCSGAILKTYVPIIEKPDNTVQIKVERIYDFEHMKSLLSEELKKTETKPQKEKDLGDFLLENMASMLSLVHFEYTDSTIISHHLDSAWASRIKRQISMKIKTDKDTTLKIKDGESTTIIDETIDIN